MSFYGFDSIRLSEVDSDNEYGYYLFDSEKTRLLTVHDSDGTAEWYSTVAIWYKKSGYLEIRDDNLYGLYTDLVLENDNDVLLDGREFPIRL